MSFAGNPAAVAASTAEISTRELYPTGATGTFGFQSLKSAADDVIGVPLLANPQRPFPDIRGGRSYYAHSLSQLFFGTNATTLPTQISLQQILAGNFYVGVLAPIVPISWSTNYKIKFDTLTFGHNLPQVVPEEGRTRIGKWKYDSKEFTVQRYGLGARFTHDFLLNPTGMERARGVLDQMQLSIEDHLKIGVIHALLHCRDSANAREAEAQLTPTLDMQQKNLQRSKDFFGILQFRKDGPTALLNHARNVFNSFGGKFNTAVCHWMQQMYCTNLNPKTTKYAEIGPTAADNFYHLMGGNETFGKGGPPAYLVEEFAHGRGKAPLDFLKHKIMIGGYAIMFDHIPRGAGNNYEGYNNSMRDIEIMSGDNGGDGRARVPYAEALVATKCWDAETRQLIGPDHPSLKRGGADRVGGKRCSFWYRDAATNSDQAITRLGQMPAAHFGTGSMRNLALTVIYGLDPPGQAAPIRAQVISAIAVLNSALNQMASEPNKPANRAWVDAYIRADGIPAAPANFSATLPPWGATGKMLRRIRDFASTATSATIAASGLATEKLKQVGEAVDIIQTHLGPRLIAAFGSNNAFFSGPNGDSYDGVFDAFIDNGIAPHLISIYSVAPGSAGDAGVAIAPPAGPPLGERRDAISATLFETAKRFQDRLTGRLDAAEVIAQAYINPAAAGVGGAPAVPAAAIPLARRTAVAIAAAAGAAAPSVLYDPIQSNGGASVVSSWGNLRATLPTYAQESLTDNPANVDSVPIPGGANALFGYSSNMVPADSAYDTLVKVLLNYGTGAPANAAVAIRSAAARAIALGILSQVSVVPGDRARSDANIAAVLGVLGITPASVAAAGNAEFDRVGFDARVPSLPAGALANVASAGGAPSPIKPAQLVQFVLKLQQDVTAQATTGAAAYFPGGAAAAPAVINPRNYEVGVFRANGNVVLSFAFNASLLPAKGDGSAPVVSAGDLEILKTQIRQGAIGANQASKSRLLDTPAMHANGSMVRTDLPLAPIGVPGGMINVERDVRESENFGLGGQRIDYSDMAPGVAQPATAAAVLNSRFTLRPGAGAAPAPVTPTPTPGAPQDLGAAASVATPSMKRNWELIGRDIPEIHLAAIARIYLGTSSSLNNVLGMHNANVIVPFTVLLTRPFIRVDTLTMFLLWAGKETMMTVFGQPNTTWGDDPGTQSYELTITFKSRTIVTKPENVLQIFNAFICGYEGGMGASFFTPENLAVYLNKNDMSAPHHSIIPILEPYEQYLGLRPPSLMSLTGSFSDVRHMNKFPDTPILNDAAHYYNRDYARAMWGFGHYSIGMYGDENTQHLYQFVHALNETSVFFSRVDFTCWKDQSLHAHPRTGEYTIMSPGDGLFPNDVIGPGMFTAMRSYFKEFSNFEYQKTGRFTFVNA